MRTRNLARALRSSFLGNIELYHAFRFERKKKRCEKVIRTYLGDNVAPEKKQQIMRNMKRAMVKFHWNFEEYFLFRYEQLNDEERRAFFSNYDKDIFCDKVNNDKHADLLNDKWETYRTFKKFFKRDAVLLHDESDIETSEVKSFLENHNSFIMKPAHGSLGKGIEIVRATNYDEAVAKLKDVLSEHNTEYILEELIVQVEELAKWHPQSVNTLRIRTIILKDRIHICHPMLRIGRGDAVVDNAGSGGVFVVLDEKTGKPICSCDEFCNEYTVHPDTGFKFDDLVIPRWEEAIETAKQLAMVFPDVKYVGWDLALTDKGWVMIEGNDHAQLGFQYATHIGFRKEIEDLMKQM